MDKWVLQTYITCDRIYNMTNEIICKECCSAESECDMACGEFLDKEEWCPGYVLRVAERKETNDMEPDQD